MDVLKSSEGYIEGEFGEETYISEEAMYDPEYADPHYLPHQDIEEDIDPHYLPLQDIQEEDEEDDTQEYQSINNNQEEKIGRYDNYIEQAHVLSDSDSETKELDHEREHPSEEAEVYEDIGEVDSVVKEGMEVNRDEEGVIYYSYHRMDSDPDMFKVHHASARIEEEGEEEGGEESQLAEYVGRDQPECKYV